MADADRPAGGQTVRSAAQPLRRGSTSQRHTKRPDRVWGGPHYPLVRVVVPAAVGSSLVACPFVPANDNLGADSAVR
jgi:hypothetical protein